MSDFTVNTSSQTFTPLPEPHYDIEFHCNDGVLETWMFTIIAGQQVGDPVITDTGRPCPIPDGTTTPTGQFVRLDEECRCDDVNGDGSEIVGYVTAHKVVCEPDGTLTRTLIGDFTDNTYQTIYPPVNPVECCDLGDDLCEATEMVVGSRAHRVTIDGPAIGWKPTPTTWLESVTAIAIQGETTVTDAVGVTSTLHEGESNKWCSENQILVEPPCFDVPTGGRISVIWTEPVTQ